MTELEQKARGEELLSEIKRLAELSNPIKDINLFSILGMETKEVSAHSAFLYYVFKPFEINSVVDDGNLRCLYTFLKAKKPRLPDNPKNLNIYREVVFDKGRLDFLIRFNTEESGADAIVIELKIKADEQDNQISRYSDYLKDNDYSSDNIIFLTLKGDESYTGESTPVLLEDLCENVFKKIKEIRDDKYMVILNQYKSLVKKLGEKKYMNLSEIIKNKNDFLLIDSLNEAKKAKLTELLKSFTDQLKDKLSALISEEEIGIELLRNFDEGDINGFFKDNKKTFPSLVYRINDNEELLQLSKKVSKDGNEFDVYFFVEIEYNIYCGFTIRSHGVDNTYSMIKVDKDNKIVSEKKGRQGNVHLFESGWLSWEYVLCNKNKVNFYEYSNQNDSFLKLISPIEDGKLEFNQEDIDSIANYIIKSYKEQYKLLKESLTI